MYARQIARHALARASVARTCSPTPIAVTRVHPQGFNFYKRNSSTSSGANAKEFEDLDPQQRKNLNDVLEKAKKEGTFDLDAIPEDIEEDPSVTAENTKKLEEILKMAKEDRASMTGETHNPDLSSSSTVPDAEFTEPVIIKETMVGKTGEKKGFQAETQKLLHIVAHSLYSDRQVFIREIISNASDALEKYRYLQSTNQDVVASTEELAIKIQVDEKQKLFVIQDNGVGMTKEELETNLGTIAHSGTKSFVSNLEGEGATKKEGLIGQFGVGFYSTFMVGNKVQVFTKSCKTNSIGYCWESDGLGEYTITEAENVEVGCKIVIHVKDDMLEYTKYARTSDLVKNMSNFVNYPIKVNGDLINSIQPLWTMKEKDITEQMHNEFYKFISFAYDEPTYHMQFQTDAPIDIKALFYIPSMHMEKFGMGQMDAGVSLYSRKVLIQKNPENLLPKWMRFVRGVVDSADIPLNLSREMLQDNRLVKRMSDVLSLRIIKFLEKMLKRDAEKYDKWYKEFGNFIREGVCTDNNRNDIAKLLRIETSSSQDGQTSSLTDYVSKMGADQKSIYYLTASSRELAKQSPYLESFIAKGQEVIFLYEPIDEIVMTNLQKFDGKPLVSIESSEAYKGEQVKEATEADKDLCEWMKNALGSKVKDVKVSSRISSAPAMIVDHESPVLRRMMRQIDSKRASEVSPQVLEINTEHELIKLLQQARETNVDVANNVAMQVLDAAMISAGMVDDPKLLLSAMNHNMKILLQLSIGDKKSDVEK